MDLSRRGFLKGAGGLAAGTLVAESWTGGKVVLAREAPRQPIKLEGHETWGCVRPHMLGHLSLEEMATGLPGPWQEYLASWWVEGTKVFVPIIKSLRADVPKDYLGAKLNSGYLMEAGEECWEPFIDKWNREVAVPLYGKEIRTKKLGVAILTNIYLFRLAYRYQFPKD